MTDNKQVICVVILLLLVIAIGCGCFFQHKNKENFGYGQDGTWKVQREIGNAKGDMFAIPGTYQSLVSPRANMGINYGAHINYNMPNLAHQAVPSHPLGHQGLKKGQASGSGQFETVNALGEIDQPIIYDRLIYANRNNRLRSQGDPIRGDLPIVPCAADWFRPSAHPNIDLQTGALSVLGGIDNDTTKDMAQLLAKTSGDTNISGVSMAGHRSITSGNSLADIQVSAFP